uniref:condensation domain-containing protein n=1 Tax=Gynuella sp. TaxID=2969146 RepID=UPI003D11C779
MSQVISAADLIHTLNQQGVELYMDQGTLKARSRKGRLTPDVVKLIKAHKPQLQAHLTATGGSVHQRPPITAVPRTGAPIPLSYAQQRLWFIDQLSGGSAHYNIPGALRVQGRFDDQVAEQALQRIVDRHEPLRTVFRQRG